MLLCQSSRDFVAKNNQKIQQLTGHFSKRYGVEDDAEDIAQDICYKLLKKEDMSSLYDPKYRGYKNRSSSISTYMWSTIKNSVITHQRHVSKMQGADFSEIEDEDQEQAIIKNELAIDYQMMSTDTPELAEDMEDFHYFLMKNSTYNKKWILRKVSTSRHRIFSSYTLWSYLKSGYTQKEIAELLDISPKMAREAIAHIRDAYIQYQQS